MFQKLNNQKGQGMMEYIIIASLVGIFCLAAVGSYGKKLNERVKQMTRKITNETKIDFR